MFSRFSDQENTSRSGVGSLATSKTTRVQHSGIIARISNQSLDVDITLNGNSEAERGFFSLHSNSIGGGGGRNGVSNSNMSNPILETVSEKLGIREIDKRCLKMETWISTGRSCIDVGAIFDVEARTVTHDSTCVPGAIYIAASCCRWSWHLSKMSVNYDYIKTRREFKVIVSLERREIKLWVRV